jgi:hypothetical protein
VTKESIHEDDVLRKMLKTPPKPFTPKAKKELSPDELKAKKQTGEK